MSGALTAQSVPVLRRGIRRHFDAARGQNVLQCPERVILLDEIADAIVALCDGQHDVAAISASLAQRYAADVALVQADVTEFIAGLLEKQVVTV